MPVLLLGLLVVLAGLAIGGLAGRLTAMHAHLPKSLPSISPVPTQTPTLAPVATPTPKTTPSPKPTPSPKASPSATPSSSPSPSASPEPTPTAAEPSATLRPAAVASPKARPTLTSPKARPTLTPRVAPKSTATPRAPALAGSAARALVRVYLADLARGDSAGAAALLASGNPDTFIDGTLQIGAVDSTPTASGAQSVTAQIIVGVKHYTMTFLVGKQNGRDTILSHAASSATPGLP